MNFIRPPVGHKDSDLLVRNLRLVIKLLLTNSGFVQGGLKASIFFKLRVNIELLITKNPYSKTVYLTFRFIWIVGTKFYDFSKDMSPLGCLLANAILKYAFATASATGILNLLFPMMTLVL